MKAIIENLIVSTTEFVTSKLIPPSDRLGCAIESAKKLAEVIFTGDDLRLMLEGLDENIKVIESSVSLNEHMVAIIGLSNDNPLIKIFSPILDSDNSAELYRKMNNNIVNARKDLKGLKEKRSRIARMLELVELEELTRCTGH